MSAKHTLGTDLEKHLSDEDNANGISRGVTYDSLQDQLRKVDFSTNIGNAKIDGLTRDSHVSPIAYNTALVLYLITYVIFEVPANIVLKRFDPQFWLPLLTFAWGVTSVSQGLITNQLAFSAFIFVMLGIIKAGLFPGVVFIFSVYYLRRERHWRVALFFGGAALAGAFGGVLAYVIGKMDGDFHLEGLLTIAMSVVAIFLVPTWPPKANGYGRRFQEGSLTDAERSRLLTRLDKDSDDAVREEFAWKYVRQAFVDPLVWGYAFLNHGFAFTLYTLRLFLVSDNFLSNTTVRMTVPPYVLSCLVARAGRRAPFIIGSAIVAILAGAQYAGVHFSTLGVYTGEALLLSWPSDTSGQTKRAVDVAMQITIGGMGAITGVLIYRPALSAHHFREPHTVAIGYLTFAIANRRRAKIIGAGKVEEVDRETKVLLGDREIHWKYHM
ncbi:major facilitator superfamily domain-containing protein [Russula emetica]|nr:major facilitator superfamily domain-containing protein [Russula emetica]